MSGINTVIAKRYWKDETKYLEKIQFACVTEDGENITLITDEEGNGEIILTPAATKYLIKKLKMCLNYIEHTKEE